MMIRFILTGICVIAAALLVHEGMAVQANHAQTLPECKHGVHLLSPSDEDFVTAAELVNANGGRNCWVTIVVRQDEMTTANLQRMNDLARQNSIQIVYRIERGFDQNSRWLMPNRGTTLAFIRALEGLDPESGAVAGPPLNPFGKDMYVVLGNEPTHAAMCGGCTPEEFAEWSIESVRMLHEASDRLDVDIHVGMAGHDVASPQRPHEGLYDAAIFMERMFAAQPDLLCEVDMWVSHSYPRGFVGSAHATGRLSPYGYEWELAFARSHAREDCKEHVEGLPVMITETGYRVGQGGVPDDRARTESQTIIQRYSGDRRVKMFNFFAYRYCGEPFETFALAGCDVSGLNGVGTSLRDAPKIAGSIRHIHKARAIMTCPEILVEGQEATCELSVLNMGTDIWKDIGGDYGLALLGDSVGSLGRGGAGGSEGVRIGGSDRVQGGADGESSVVVAGGKETGVAAGGSEGSMFNFTRFRDVLPGKTLTATLRYNPGVGLGQRDLTIGLQQQGRLVLGLATWRPQVFAKPDLELKVQSVFGRDVEAQGAQVQIFDERDELVYRSAVNVVEGRGMIDGVNGVTFEKCYRIVLIVDKNLPVQIPCHQFVTGVNEVEMPRLLALDRDGDGRLSFGDARGL